MHRLACPLEALLQCVRGGELLPSCAEPGGLRLDLLDQLGAIPRFQPGIEKPRELSGSPVDEMRVSFQPLDLHPKLFG
jgi:hypothetical protein